MRLSLSILASATAQVSFVALAFLGSWQSASVSSFTYIEETETRHVALHIPEPALPEQPIPLATTTKPELRKPQVPPAQPAQKKPQPKPPVKKLVKKKTPPKVKRVKVIVAAPADATAPTSPAALAEETSKPLVVDHAQPSLATDALPPADAVPAAIVTPPTAQTSSPSAGVLSDVDRAGALKAYKKLLFSTIDKKKSVPRAARRARLEGTVYLKVTFDHTGEILSIKVRKSSGHKVLDDGAIKTLRSLKKLPAPPSELGWTKKSLTIPIRYKIK